MADRNQQRQKDTLKLGETKKTESVLYGKIENIELFHKYSTIKGECL